MRVLSPSAAAAIALCSVLVAAAPAEAEVARFALIVGNNRGAMREQSLRYAERDATRVSELLIDLGAFPRGQVHLLLGRSPKEVLAALANIESQMRAAVPSRFERGLLVFYFSGHADGKSLELGRENLLFGELRRVIDKQSADIKILFVDSCQSGRLTAAKGGRAGPSFDLSLEETLDANGTAILTSSSAGEKSQESGELGGSFFTHYLLSGLRGTADFDQDQRITLGEVYQYAYGKTVAETARTLSGTQHPTYDYRISGRGNVVLTELGQGRSLLVFGPETQGTFFVLTREAGEVVAELNKASGTWRSLAVPVGEYVVAQRRGAVWSSAQVAVASGQQQRLDPLSLREEERLSAFEEKGHAPRGPLAAAVLYGLASGSLKQYAALHQAIAGLRIDLGPLSVFPQLSFGQARIDDERLHYRMRQASFSSQLAWRFEYSVLDLFAGISLGASLGWQELSGEAMRKGTIFTYAAVLGIDVPIVRGLAIDMFWEAGSQVFRADGLLQQRITLRGLLGPAYHF